MSRPNLDSSGRECVLAILTFLTLMVLWGYARGTKKIANASVLQTENSQMPFLSVVQEGNIPGQVRGWCVSNQGFGPAMNIRGTFISART